MSIISAYELRALYESAGHFDKDGAGDNEREHDERLALASSLQRAERQAEQRRKEAAKEVARARRARFF